MKKTTLILLMLIVLLGASLRLYQLGQVPHGVTNDELGYIYNAYSLAQTGHNVFGEPYPLFSYLAGRGFPFMPIPTYLLMLVFKVLPLSAFVGRLPNALMGSASVLALFFLTRELFKDETIALLSALFLAISPWHIFFSRIAYDVVVASFFYLLTVVAGVLWVRRRLLLPASFLLIALFSYRGMTPITVGLAPLLLWYGKKVLRLRPKRFLLYGLSFGAVIILFAGLAFVNQQRGFIAEAQVDSEQLAWNIELAQRETQGPQRIKRLFLNKPLFLLRRWSENYLRGYAPGLLFLEGEASQIYSMWFRGKFYLFEVITLSFSIFYFLKTRSADRPSLFVLGMVAAAGLPGLVGGPPYATRNFFMTFPLAIASGCGLYQLLRSVRWRRAVYVILAVIICFSLVHFLFDYYWRYAYQRAEVWAKSLKDISAIMATYQKQGRGVAVTETSFGDVLQFAFYNHVPADSIQRAWQTRTTGASQVHQLKNVYFLGGCNDSLTDFLASHAIDLLIVKPACMKEATPSGRILDFYGNTVWKTYTLKK